MAKLGAFNFITLNGYYKGIDESIAWHHHGGEEAEFSASSVQPDSGILLFGRVTYEMMAAFWPTQAAKEAFPLVAEGMNKSEKIVFSQTLKRVSWENTRIAKDLTGEIKKLKKSSPKNLTVLGSGKIVAQLANEGLIDSYQIMIDPVAIGKGSTLFSGLHKSLELKLVSSRVFTSGVVLLRYEPIAKSVR